MRRHYMVNLAVAEVVPKSIAVFDQVIKLVKRHLPMSQ